MCCAICSHLEGRVGILTHFFCYVNLAELILVVCIIAFATQVITEETYVHNVQIDDSLLLFLLMNYNINSVNFLLTWGIGVRFLFLPCGI